jgi:hypothetical protein
LERSEGGELKKELDERKSRKKYSWRRNQGRRDAVLM